MPKEQPLGIIAGGGQFPALVAKAAKKRGKKVIAVGHKGETLPELLDDVDSLHWVKLGQLGKTIKYLRREGVNEAIFAGTITKTRIFSDVFPDLRGLSLWNKIDNRQDDAVLRAVAGELEREGIKVLESTCFLKHLLFPSGLLTDRKPTPEQMEDVRFGWKVAKEIGRLDIGQCVIVKDKIVLAVEAIEGTDEAISRAGNLSGPGSVVVKVRKPNQDFRFDLPSTGLKTIETLQAAGASVLAVEAGQSLLFDSDKMIKAAEENKIVVMGISEKEIDNSLWGDHD